MSAEQDQRRHVLDAIWLRKTIRDQMAEAEYYEALAASLRRTIKDARGTVYYVDGKS